MSEYNMTHTGKELDDAINKVRSGYIMPEGAKQITSNGTHDVKAYENAIVDVPVSKWALGTLTGSGKAGDTFTVPYSSIGFIPKRAVLIAASSSAKVANGVICFHAGETSSRYWHFGSSTSTVTSGHDDVLATFGSNGITFPAISSASKYAAVNYIWFAMG